MNSQLQTHTARLRECRDSLLASYDADTLHDLRVAIRHLRSLLKPLPGAAPARQRKHWAKVADATNDARDWDVFGTCLSNRLDSAALAAVRPHLDQRRDAARAQALAILASRQWDKTLASWQDYLESAPDEQPDSIDPRPLGKVEHRLAKTGRRALRSDSPEDWHKLRIAVKDLRYTLEARRDAGSSKPLLGERIDWCKALQDALGDWHDCVVQRELLEQLRTDSRAAGDATSTGFIDDMLAWVNAHREGCLLRAGDLLGSAAAP